MESLVRTSKKPNGARTALLGLLTIFLLSGCGASSKLRDGSVAATAMGLGIECGTFSSASSASLSGKITTYYRFGQLVEDHVRVRITSAPAALTQGQTGTLQFFRWSATQSTGRANLDATPLSFVIETPEGLPLSEKLTSLNLATIGQIRSRNGMTNGTVQDFLNYVVINLSGTEFSWNAIKVIVYQDSEPVAEADGLIPIFAANPNTYASNHAPMLAQLHPFWAQRTTALSDAEWISRARSYYCF